MAGDVGDVVRVAPPDEELLVRGGLEAVLVLEHLHVDVVHRRRSDDLGVSAMEGSRNRVIMHLQ